MKNLIKPINELERIEDKKLVWRRKVNYEIKKNYDKIFNLIDMLIFLKVPSFKYVYEWRSLQEIKLKKIYWQKDNEQRANKKIYYVLRKNN